MSKPFLALRLREHLAETRIGRISGIACTAGKSTIFCVLVTLGTVETSGIDVYILRIA